MTELLDKLRMKSLWEKKNITRKNELNHGHPTGPPAHAPLLFDRNGKIVAAKI